MDKPQTAPLQDWVFSYLNHELRTPLSAMLGFSQMLLDGVYGEVNDQQKDRLERVLRSSQLLLRRLDLLLDYQRVFQNELDFTHSVVSVRELIQDALTATTHDNRGRLLQIILPDNAAEVKVGTNRLWAGVAVREVLLHACTEARPDPTVWVYARADQEQGKALVALRYHAPPIDAWRRGDLFSLDNHAGIGLPLAQALLTRMGGNIEYDSVATRHEITLLLPLADSL